jgi:stage III sporulation protein AB
MIFSCFSFAGFSLSADIKRKSERLEIERKLTEDISTLIKYRALTMMEITKQLKNLPGNQNMDFLKYAASDNSAAPFPEIWKRSVDSDSNLSPEEKTVLKDMGSELGTTDAGGQLAALKIYQEKFQQMLYDQQEKYIKKGRMYRSLGVLFGAMAGIMFI